MEKRKYSSRLTFDLYISMLGSVKVFGCNDDFNTSDYYESILCCAKKINLRLHHEIITDSDENYDAYYKIVCALTANSIKSNNLDSLADETIKAFNCWYKADIPKPRKNKENNKTE